MIRKFFSSPETEINVDNYYREIFEENEYNRGGIFIEKGDIVLDCGANVGIFTDYALQMGASRVYSYEAEEITYQHYLINTRSENVFPTLGMVGHEHYTIQKILDQHGIEKIDFAKIDIEGSEWDLFEYMTTEELLSVKKWAIEVHTFSGHPNVPLEDKKDNLWKLLKILHKFSTNGFQIYFEHIHQEWDVVHLFAIQKKVEPLSLDNFDWGWMNDDSDHFHYDEDGSVISLPQYHKRSITREIYEYGLYNKFFDVEGGDIVLDIGASIGPFTYSILHREPKHVYCLEPSITEFPTLVKNTLGYPVTHINKGISHVDGIIQNKEIFGEQNIMEGISFSSLLKLYSIGQIDFLKTDCEGGEYEIFNDNNFDWVTKNIKKVVGEWHLSSPELKSKFRNFRDTYLKHFSNFEVMSIDGHFIKWDLWNEHFLEYYDEVIIHIDNR